MTTNMLLIDDHAVVRAGVRTTLESSERTLFIEEASCFSDAVTKIWERHWDVVILDLSLPGKSGLDILRHIRRGHPSLPVLILSVHSDDDYGVRALKAGASGYVRKSAVPEQLLDAITTVLDGRRYISPELGENLATRVVGETHQDPHRILTNREFEVFRLIADGKRTAVIAKNLSISPKTVHSHRRNILKKLRLSGSADVVRYAFHHGII